MRYTLLLHWDIYIALRAPHSFARIFESSEVSTLLYFIKSLKTIRIVHLSILTLYFLFMKMFFFLLCLASSSLSMSSMSLSMLSLLSSYSVPFNILACHSLSSAILIAYLRVCTIHIECRQKCFHFFILWKTKRSCDFLFLADRLTHSLHLHSLYVRAEFSPFSFRFPFHIYAHAVHLSCLREPEHTVLSVLQVYLNVSLLILLPFVKF